MRIALSLAAVVVLALLVSGWDGAYTISLVTEGAPVLESGETLNGELAITGGDVTTSEDSLVTGSVYMLNGTLFINGRVDGDISVVGGRLTLGPESHVVGNLNVAGRPEIAPEATIDGETNVGAGVTDLLDPSLLARSVENRLTWFLPEAILMGILAFLAARLVPRPVGRVSRAVTHHAVVSGAMGALAGLVFPALIVIMAFTIILAPLSVLALLLMMAAIAFGWVGIGTAFGRWIVRRGKWRLSPSATAFLGTALFMVLVNALGVIPVVGGFLSLLVAVTGFGGVLLTRFGIQEFTPAADTLES